jgi:phosphoribosylformylglycinamidine (FGAM) synthase-like enzyme
MLAQTWSEHCKHKIFAANIDYVDSETGEKKTIKSLFNTYIKQTTEDLWDKRPFLRSVFHDNSGVIAFDEKTLVCFKAETHNSPSALDPYGGAITGIVGVNRDIWGPARVPNRSSTPTSSVLATPIPQRLISPGTPSPQTGPGRCP